MADKERGQRRTLQGRIKSNKMEKTVVVEVERRTMHPVYKKFISSRERYMAHDERNECTVGDRVEIRESRPLSRHKRWVVVRVVVRAETT